MLKITKNTKKCYNLLIVELIFALYFCFLQKAYLCALARIFTVECSQNMLYKKVYKYVQWTQE